jgi:hypothetical protein
MVDEEDKSEKVEIASKISSISSVKSSRDPILDTQELSAFICKRLKRMSSKKYRLRKDVARKIILRIMRKYYDLCLKRFSKTKRN